MENKQKRLPNHNLISAKIFSKQLLIFDKTDKNIVNTLNYNLHDL